MAWRVYVRAAEAYLAPIKAPDARAALPEMAAAPPHDLIGLVAAGALVRDGERRSARYRPNIAMEEIAPVDIADIR